MPQSAQHVMTVDEDGEYVAPGGGSVPAGAATSAKQDTGNTSLSSIDGKLTTLSGYVDTLETLIAATNTAIGSTNGFVDGIEGLLTTLNGYVDGLETLIGTGNTTATAIAGYVDGLETLVGSTNTALATIDGHVDGLETVEGTTADAAVTTDAAGTISAKLRGLIVLLAAMSAKLPAALDASGGLKVQAGGYTVQSVASITRPADTTAYAAKDAIADLTSGATILTFANCARTSGGSGYVTKARLQTDQAANVSAYRLHLYDATLTAVVDNAAQTVLYANRASYLGYIDFPAAATDGSDTAVSQSTQAPLPFVAAGTSLFGMLETITGFTPANAQKFYIQLGIEQN